MAVALQWISEYTSVAIMLVLLAVNSTHYWIDYYSAHFHWKPLSEYDFVVVGGGSAGAVVASRLSENGKYSVMLLEAGGHPSPSSSIPIMVSSLQETPLNWNFTTEPQRNGTKSFNENRSRWPRGKVLGGTGILNYMIYVRGNRQDFDHWNELGNEGWSYDDVLPFFVKSENNRGTSIDENCHNRNGPLTIEDRVWLPRLADGFIGAGLDLGFEQRDINGDNQTGFAVPQVSMDRGKRISSYGAFLAGKSRPNLFIATHALVEKILFDDSKRAYAVKYKQNGHHKIVMARKEIILSAGAIGSPQILMLSGVGPKDHLKSLEIDVVADKKVGFNLQDHLEFQFGPLTHNDSTASWDDVFSPESWWTYLLHGKGQITSNAVDGMAFKTSSLSDRPNWPDIQLMFASISVASDHGDYLYKLLNIREDVWKSFYLPLIHVNTAAIFVALARPKSRGRIQLRSADPADHPIIDPRYYSHPQDAKVMLEGIRFAEQVIRTPAMQKFNVSLHPQPYPACKHHIFGTDAYWKCYIDQSSFTIYHPVGTCKMGPEKDPEAVVDPQLRVYGVKGLRVADASIMPKIVNGNTNAACVMIGEKAADMILNTWDHTVNDWPASKPLGRRAESSFRDDL